jgi:Stage II sporulation protein E (SpoIIE)
MLQRLGRARSAGGETRAAGPVNAGDADGTAGPSPAGQEHVTEVPAAALTGAGAGEAASANGQVLGGEAAKDGRAAKGSALPGDFSLPPQDPLRAFLLSQAGAVDITRLELASPALAALKAAGLVLVVPLVSSGELIGLLNLGPRLSERGYSGDDRRLLSALAGYAAPAMRVGQLVRQQQAEARDRERIEQELKVAQLIQQQFLPKSLPDLPSWHVAAFYRPARTVGGAELRARGMPLGLMPGMAYEEKTFQMRPGDSVLLHSDGLAEAHNPDREMFGFPRVAALVGRTEAGEALIDACLAELEAFTGHDHEQEDDITLVMIERKQSAIYAGGQS